MTPSSNNNDLSQEKSILDYISNTPVLLSLLYDMEMMPEQLKRGSLDWYRMLILAERWKSKK